MKLLWCDKSAAQHAFLSKGFSLFYDLNRYLSSENYYCCEVYIDDQLAAVSTVEVQRDRDRLLLLHTYVDPRFRRMGINSSIKSEVEQKARDLGVSYLAAHVREQNRASLNSLLKSGFEIVESEQGVYKNGDIKISLRKEV